MSQWEYDSYAAIYDNASPATELLAEKGALEYRHCDFVPDYWAEIPEDKAPKGRVLLPKDALPTMSDGGEVAIRTMGGKARADGIDIRTGHRVQRTIVDDNGAVIGVEADTGKGKTVAIKARRAVIFATGGFTHDVTMRKNFLSVPVFGGCAARSNEGDFVNIGTAAGAELRNMNYSWMCPIVLEKALNDDPALIGTFSPSGNSMIYVDKTGRRVTNEKLAYNESAQVFFNWDPAKSEYPNLVLVAIWDERSQKNSASHEYGRFIVPDGADDSPCHQGRHAGGADEERPRAREEIRQPPRQHGDRGRFRADAEGDDRSLQRLCQGRQGQRLPSRRAPGRAAVQRPGRRKPGGAEPDHVSDHQAKGPYYAALLTGGNLDTKGGPVTNADGQVLDHTGKPITGLYGVGNCVASASARAYWAGGATLGPDPGIRLSRGQRRQSRAATLAAAAQTVKFDGRKLDGTDDTDDDGRAAQVRRDRISEGIRQWRGDLDRRLDPRPLRRRRAGLFPEMGPGQRQGADRPVLRRRRRHAEVDHPPLFATSTGSSPAAT